jgi:hypothetical protein
MRIASRMFMLSGINKATICDCCAGIDRKALRSCEGNPTPKSLVLNNPYPDSFEKWVYFEDLQGSENFAT